VGYNSAGAKKIRSKAVVGKHYQWHKKWTLDIATCTATHETGAIVDFSCVGGEWVGAFRGGSAAAETWLSAHKFNPNDANGRARLSRIMKEANDTWNRRMAKKLYDENKKLTNP
jgi:hypothetical protein